jgi:peptide/nickel transport system substrate-binding protein
MKSGRELIIVLLAVSISAMFLMTPGFTAPSDAAAAPYVTMTLGTVLLPDTLNPFSMTTGISYMITWLAFETLTTDDPTTLEPVPMLAASWEASVDGKVWTYHLVQNSFWHDGVQVTAEDVAFTYNLILNNPTECAMYGSYLTNVTEVLVIDPYTVRITTEVPKATMLRLSIPILPEHLWSAVPIANLGKVDLWDATYFPDGPVGSGPMILESWSKVQKEIRMLKWDRYHIDTINMDEVLFKLYTNEDSMMNALYSGYIDVAMYVPPLAWDSTLLKDNIAGQAAHALDERQLNINCAPESIRTKLDSRGHTAFPKASTNLETTNLAVRQAIAMSVNKTQILDEVLKNLGEEGDSIVPTATPFWHYFVPESEKFKFDLDAAKNLLESAGYVDGDGDNIRENTTTGAELSFSFYYITGQVTDQLAANMMSAWWLQVGIDASPQGIQESVLYQKWVNLEYDMCIWNWQPDTDPSFILSVLTTEEIPADNGDYAAWSDTYYSNPYYDQLFIDQQTTVNATQRQAIIHEMQQIVYRDCPYVVLWYPYYLYAYRTDTFTNYPDMRAHPGMIPDDLWFYFEVVPAGWPSNVDAGPDQTAYVGDTLSFTGSATDQNDPVSSLNWTWVFEEPDLSTQTRWGQTVDYTFNNLGTVNVTLTVTDPGGLSDDDLLVVTVEPIPLNAGWIVGYVNSSSGGAIVGAEVSIGNNTRSTDSLGHYNLTLVDGTYEVNVSAPGHDNGTGAVVIVAGQETWLNFTLAASAWTLKGHVYDSSTSAALVNAKVSLSASNDEEMVALTNATGYYEIILIPFGTCDVNVSKTGYETNETELSISTSGVVTRDFQLTPVSGDGGGGGISTIAMVGIAVAVIAIIAGVAAFILLKRRKTTGPPPGSP